MTATIDHSKLAPGAPGHIARWTSSAKIGVGTALYNDCNLWFTISHGIVNEVYWPRIDVANLRDMELIVTDGKEFFSEEKRDAIHDYTTLGEGVPAYHLINTCNQGRYRIEKRIIADTRRSVLLQQIEFIPLIGTLKDYKIFVLLAPHMRNKGMGNTGWSGEYKGFPMLFASSTNTPSLNMACACSTPFKRMTVGYVGISDAWQELKKNKDLLDTYERADDGNIAMAAEIDLEECGGRFVLSLSFGVTSFEAGLQSRGALLRPFEDCLKEYISQWESFHSQFDDLGSVDPLGGSLFRMSNAVLKIHEGKRLSGSVIASLSIPWGFSRGDNDIGGYHLIWPRDQAQTAISLLAANDVLGAYQTLNFLMCTQEHDGHWVQCMWEDGTPYWPGLQMDETALPVILADIVRRKKAIGLLDPTEMVRRAALFIIKNGPVTQEDRWEEVAGYTPFTIACEISALLCAADFLSDAGDFASAEYLRDTADWWNESIERWLYVRDTPLANQYGVDGYYVRVMPSVKFQDVPPQSNEIYLKNLPPDQSVKDYRNIVSVDALTLVRQGLRSPTDPRILNTIKVIDALLKTDTPRGPIWHRYNHDGYGEHADGSPFNGTGIGRGWPLLCGERAHYEVAAGNMDKAKDLLRVMASYAGVGGLLPEQIWDSEDIPEHSLFKGHSAGSAKPLVWAHAEYITLLRSIKDGKVFTMPPQTQQRYLLDKVKAVYAIWRMDHQLPFWPVGKRLRIQADVGGFVRWSKDNWASHTDSEFVPLGLGIYFADLPVENFSENSEILFTFYWVGRNEWENRNYSTIAKA
ncbi:MAG: glycoside hydrolase family 15 protein [Parachlamydiales bacterium]|jgi:glucoamylase